MKALAQKLAILGCMAFAIPTFAQPAIDGFRDTYYCSPLAIQDTQTQFGDSNRGLVDFANGSELDNASAWISDGVLYIHIAGNLESNFNKLELFFDTRDGGQNRVRDDNAFSGVNRMGGDGTTTGLLFDDGFTADYWLSVTGGGDPYSLYVDYCELKRSDDEPGEGYYVGHGVAADQTDNGALDGGNNPNDVRCTIDNRNIAGVTGGTGAGDQTAAAAVETGVELAIPLSQLGNPTGDIRISTFVNGGGHDFASNQFLGGIGGGGNLGEPRNIDMTQLTGNQYFTVSPGVTPCGACCVAELCQVTTEGDCIGTYLGDGVTCFGNPCSVVETGSCCVDETCTVVTADVCAGLGGDYRGDNSTCDGDVCNRGACCVGTTCEFVRAEVCNTDGGRYRGNDTNCDSAPCARGACCLPDNVCTRIAPAACANQGGDYQGDDSDCTSNPCGTPAGVPSVDGTADDLYGAAIVIQDTQTGFGDSNRGEVDRANGSELDQAFGYVANGRLYITLAGNLESNNNDLEIFIDSVDGGQNKLRGDNPDVDFNGLNRMGDDGSGNGLKFDSEFAADYYLTVQNGGTQYALYANYARLRTDSDAGVGHYLGEGGAATDGGLNYGDNPDGVLVTLNNSNIAGVDGGLSFCSDCGEGVMTGVEIGIPLSAIGNPTGNFKICAFVNGAQHDFISNQSLAGGLWILFGYPGEPRNATFNDDDSNGPFGPQYFEVQYSPPSRIRGDSNGDGTVDFNDIDCFVAALISLDEWLACSDLNDSSRYIAANDTNTDGGVNFNDIDSFVECLINNGCP